jgi:hypothetical protein
VLATAALAALYAAPVVAQGCSVPYRFDQDSTAARRAGLRPAERRATWPALFYPRADSVLRAAGLPPLDQAPAAEGEREVRVWSEGFGVPAYLYRFVERRGRTTGEVVLFWGAPPPDPNPACGERPGETTDDLMRYTQAGRCGGFARAAGIGVCRARFTRPPDWGAVLRRMEAAGLWELPDPASLPAVGYVTVDGWGFTAELRDGARYRAYAYDNPQTMPWPEARRAVAVSDHLRAISARMRPAAVVRDYRGIYEGPAGPGARLDLDTLANFRPCGQAVTWGVRGYVTELQALRDLAPDVAGARPAQARAARARVGVRRRLYVEATGQLTPAWVARRQRSRYPRVLQLTDVRTARPWRAAECPDVR